MKILFVTGVYSRESEPILRNQCVNTGLDMAANTFQWNIIEGLAETGVDFHVISYPFLPAYPFRYKCMITPQDDIIWEGRKIGSMLSYNSLFFIKHLSIQNRLYHYAKRWVNEIYQESEEIWIISYTPCSFFSNAIIKLKKKYPRIKYCTIVADLVDDATNPSFNLSLPKLIQAKREQRLVKQSYASIDKFILLSKYMEEKIPPAKDNNIIIEGLASKVDSDSVKIKDSSLKVLLYAGALEEFTGIIDLLDSFLATDNKSFRLIICGGGSLSKQVRVIADNDNRITFLGNIPRNEVIKLQKEVTLLINPRKPLFDLTRYSFPSKTIEYMSSGTPMIGYKLDGIPEEYFNHMYIPNDLSNESLTQTLNDTLSRDPIELKEFGESAKDFIRNNKEASIQVAKILSFLKDRS